MIEHPRIDGKLLRESIGKIKKLPASLFLLMLAMYWRDILSKTDGKPPQSVPKLSGAQTGTRLEVRLLLPAPVCGGRSSAVQGKAYC